MSNPAFETVNPETTKVLEDSRVSQYLNGTTNFNVNTDGDYVSTTMMNETASFVLDEDSMAGVDYKGNKSYGTR